MTETSAIDALDQLGVADLLGPALEDVRAEPAFLPWRLRPLDTREFAALGSSLQSLASRQLKYLAWLASLAPSTHNTAPERFRLGANNEIELWLDREFVLPASDVDGRQATIGVGCKVNHLELAAREHGWSANFQPREDLTNDQTRPAKTGEPRLTMMGTVSFRPAAPADTLEWSRLICARKVIRSEFDDRVELDEALGEELRRCIESAPGLDLHLISDSPTLLFMGKFQELADTTVLNRDEFALELGEWLLEDSDPSARGMRGSEFGLHPEAARRMHYGLLRELQLLPDEIAGMAKSSNIGMRSASAVGVLTVAEDRPSARMAAGRAYEEMALRLWHHGFCTAMHAAVTEVDGPNFALRGRLRTRRRPTVVFRIGQPLHPEDWKRPHASRPLLSELLLPDDIDPSTDLVG